MGIDGMSARGNAREAADREANKGVFGKDFLGPKHHRYADAAFDSVLASLDTPEMREVAGQAIVTKVWGLSLNEVESGERGEADDVAAVVLAAIRAELAKGEHRD